MTNAGGLFFRDFDDFAAFVSAAVRTGAMGKFGFVAIGALGAACDFQMVVRAARGGALLGVSAFRIRHLIFLLIFL
jgi:hypothetical protein